MLVADIGSSVVSHNVGIAACSGWRIVDCVALVAEESTGIVLVDHHLILFITQKMLYLHKCLKKSHNDQPLAFAMFLCGNMLDIVSFNLNIMNVDFSNYSWPGVLEFLYSEYQKVSLKENMWFLERKELTDQIKQLQGKLAASEAVVVDLRNKNSMLQYCLRQIKLKSGPGKEEGEKEQEIPIPQRRPKSNKPQLSKILCSLGVPGLLENINKEIKAKIPNAALKIEIPSNINDGKKSQGMMERAPSNYKEIASLDEHQDGVRDLCFLSDKQYLVSVSEDSTMKLWNVQKPGERIDCITTIREHAGPIFTAVQGEGYVFTGGMEGLIRAWDFPRKVNPQNTKNLKVGQWINSQDQKLEPIWQLLYYPERKIMFSTSSQVSIRSFQLEFQDGAVQAKCKQSYIYQSKNTEEEDIPTAICMHQGSLFAGYVNNNFLVQFNLETQKCLNTLQFQAQGQISTNRIVSNNSIIAGAFEDAMIRIFDRSKLVHSFEAHDESVMSLSFTNNPYELFSCGQDGLVKLWDLRKYSVVCSFKAHKKKYDEAAHCVTFGKSGVTASGGADGIIKIFAPDY